MKKLKIVMFLLAGFSVGLLAQTPAEDSKIYFNAGTEKYLQGDYQAALENLGRALELDAGNTAARQLLIKVAQDGASRQHMNRNYQLAKKYLDYARRYVRDDGRIEDLYKLTMEMLQRSGENNQISPKVSPQKPPAPAPETTAAQVGEKKTPTTPVVVQKVRERVPVPVVVEKKVLDVQTIIAIVAGFLFLIAIVIIILLVRLKNKYWRLINELKSKEESLTQKNTELLVQLEKHKERLELQKETINRLNATLKEQEKKEKERLQWEMEKLSRVIPDQPLPARIKSAPIPSGHLENLSNSLEMSTMISESSNSALQVARERIANLLYNLYAYSPAAAIDFINKTLESTNPLIRANIIMGLGKIAQPETVKILLHLWKTDSDERVRRETLRMLKELRDKIQLATVSLPEELKQEVKEVIDREKKRGEWIF